MICFHGTTSQNKENIFKDGFNYSRRGLCQSGIYFITDKNIAEGYSNIKNSSEGLIEADIKDEELLKIKYEDLCKKVGIKDRENEWLFATDEIKGAKKYIIKNGYKGVEIIFNNCSEICIYDKDLIKSLK